MQNGLVADKNPKRFSLHQFTPSAIFPCHLCHRDRTCIFSSDKRKKLETIKIWNKVRARILSDSIDETKHQISSMMTTTTKTLLFHLFFFLLASISRHSIHYNSHSVAQQSRQTNHANAWAIQMSSSFSSGKDKSVFIATTFRLCCCGNCHGVA